jgi:alkanesulfonate monooxygenase SsuD/methylene tetrahydromethanopterin reductase-like flavin-dependent oxidoreductase (luciferase family)
MAVPVGLNVWSRLVEETFPYLDQTAGPFDSLWFPDHLQYGKHKVAEGWSLLAYALARYPDKLCGHEVLCNSFRNPAHLAKMVATAQALSGGRVILGLGAGWNEEEYLAYGWPFPKTRVRIAQLAEAIALIRVMWTDAPANYRGQYYQVTDAYCEPRPDPIPPIMVGGAGEKYLLRVVAQHADWWNFPFRGREDYARKQEALKNHCREVGRDYDAIQQVLRVGILIAETEGEVERVKTQPNVRPIQEDCLVGTPAQLTETLLGVLEDGADRLTVHFSDAPRPEGTDLFAATVLPHLSRV